MSPGVAVAVGLVSLFVVDAGPVSFRWSPSVVGAGLFSLRRFGIRSQCSADLAGVLRCPSSLSIAVRCVGGLRRRCSQPVVPSWASCRSRSLVGRWCPPRICWCVSSVVSLCWRCPPVVCLPPSLSVSHLLLGMGLSSPQHPSSAPLSEGSIHYHHSDSLRLTAPSALSFSGVVSRLCPESFATRLSTELHLP